MECIFFTDQGSEENTRGRSSLQYKIKVQWKAQIVVFQLFVLTWSDGDFFSTLPMEFEINGDDFRPKETEISSK